jgi:hypothetical protein
MRYHQLVIETEDDGPRRIQDLSDYFREVNGQEDLESGDEPVDTNAPDEAHHRYVRENYLFGECAAFAVALNRMTGWPIFQIKSRDSYHVFLQAPKGRLVDASGYTTLAKIRRVHRLSPDAMPHAVSASALIDDLDDDSLSDPWHQVRLAEFYIRQLHIPPFNQLAEALSESVKPLSAHNLIQRYGGRAMEYRNLPPLAKQAIRARAAEHLDPGARPKIDPKMRFGYVEIPMEAMQQAVLAAVQREGAPFKTFNEYHRWYLGHGDTPTHKTIWPIELDLDDPDQIIDDGSHRFHSYVRSGLKLVPAIYRVR